MEKRKAGTFIICALTLLLLFLFSTEKTPEGVLLTADNIYGKILGQFCKDYSIQDPGTYENPFFLLEKDNLLTCLDMEVYALNQQGKARFTPQGLVTVVFAVREDVEACPRTWTDLLKAELPVGFPQSRILRRAALAAAAWGCGQEKADLSQAVSLLKKLDLKASGEECPIVICLDAEAVYRKQQGERLTIVIPEDGTLSFSFGVLSKYEFPYDMEQAMLEAGFRLPDGRCTDPDYPSNKDYSAAHRVEDYEALSAITQNAMPLVRRTILGTRYLNSTCSLELILGITAVMMLTVFWAVYAIHRSTSRDMQKWVLMVTVQVELWLLVTMVKYIAPENSVFSRLLWYGYYVFLMGLPVSLLYVAVEMNRAPGFRTLWLSAFLAVYPVLLVMVLTNDLHMLVFSFDFQGNWNQNYSYRPGFYLIFLYSILSFFLALGILIFKSRQSPKKYGFLLPCLTALMILLYNIGYAVGPRAIRDSNLTVFTCFFVILFLEAVFSAGMIPVNRGYSDLFASTPLNMQLLDRKGHRVIAAAGAEPLTEAQLREMDRNPGTAFLRDENTLIHSEKLPCGYALWQEDISKLTQVMQSLQQSISRLETANRLLRKEEAVRRENLVSKVKSRIYDQMETDIQEESAELSELIRLLNEEKDSETYRALLPVVLCHLKRKCNLFFLAREEKDMREEELAVYLDELSEFAFYGEVQALVRCGHMGSIPIPYAMVLYDFYGYLICWSIRNGGKVLIGQLEKIEDRFQLDILASESLKDFSLTDSAQAHLKKLGGCCNCRELEDSASISLSLPLGREG